MKKQTNTRWEWRISQILEQSHAVYEKNVKWGEEEEEEEGEEEKVELENEEADGKDEGGIRTSLGEHVRILKWWAQKYKFKAIESKFLLYH